MPQPEIGVSSHSLPLLQRRRRNKGKLCSSIYEPALSLFLVHLLLLATIAIFCYIKIMFSRHSFISLGKNRDIFVVTSARDISPSNFVASDPPKLRGTSVGKGLDQLKLFFPVLLLPCTHALR